MVKKIGFAFEAPGATLDEEAFETAKFFAAELGKVVHVQVRIASDEQVHLAITIVIAPGCAAAEPSTANRGLLGNVLEFTVPQIMVEHVAVVARDKKIELPIIIIISHSNAHAPAQPCQTRIPSNVLESAVCFLVVKGNHRVAALAQPFYRRPIYQDNIEPVIIVAV